jgi:hypothetical protein
VDIAVQSIVMSVDYDLAETLRAVVLFFGAYCPGNGVYFDIKTFWMISSGHLKLAGPYLMWPLNIIRAQQRLVTTDQ